MGGQGRQEGRVWGDPAPPSSPPPARLLPSRLGRAPPAGPGLWRAGGSAAAPACLGVGRGERGAGRCACGVCAPVRPGRPGGRRHVEASLARVSGPVGKAGRGADGQASAPRLRSGGRGGAAPQPGSSAQTGTPAPEPRRPGRGEGASQGTRRVPGPAAARGGDRRGAGTQAARRGGGVEGAVMGTRFPPRGPPPSLPPSAHPSPEDYI